jgi:DNA-binding FrmR family transcriptional regulator
MVEEGACIDVLTQVSAATGARSVAVALLEEHLRHCVAAHRLRRRRADRLRPRPAKQSNDW